MCPGLLLAATTLGNWLPAPPAEFAAFTKKGHVTWAVRPGRAGRVCCVNVGTVGDRVAFVVIALGPPDKGPFTSPVRAGAAPRQLDLNDVKDQNAQAYLDLPGGGKVALPLRRQLVEVADGKVRFSDRRVTRVEVEAYLDSKPKACSLDDLLRFVDGRRKQPGTE